jgi:hypothetical protein
MKMVKKTLLAVALVAFLATVVQAADPSIKEDDSWPGHWVWDTQDICTMPIYMDVGMFVQVEKCNERKIELKQVDCGSIGKGGGDYPCYKDCDVVKVRANFEVKLGTSLTKSTGSPIDSWSAYYEGGDVVAGDGAYHGMTVCVSAWKTKIWNAAPGDKVPVGDLTITVKPNN